MNPKVIGLIILLLAVAAGTFWATREYSELNPPQADAGAAQGV